MMLHRSAQCLMPRSPVEPPPYSSSQCTCARTQWHASSNLLYSSILEGHTVEIDIVFLSSLHIFDLDYLALLLIIVFNLKWILMRIHSLKLHIVFSL